jgi:hypothetical protein
MGHRDTDWRPTCVEGYNGYMIWDHDVGPHQLNDGEVDGDIEFERDEDGNFVFEDDE